MNESVYKVGRRLLGRLKSGTRHQNYRQSISIGLFNLDNKTQLIWGWYKVLCFDLWRGLWRSGRHFAGHFHNRTRTYPLKKSKNIYFQFAKTEKTIKPFATSFWILSTYNIKWILWWLLRSLIMSRNEVWYLSKWSWRLKILPKVYKESDHVVQQGLTLK